MPQLEGWLIDSKNLLDGWYGRKRIKPSLSWSCKQRAPRVPILYTKEIRMKFKENIVI
jgi:hypothetical protein